MTGRRLRLWQFLALGALVLGGLVAVIFASLWTSGRRAVNRGGEAMREAAAAGVRHAIENQLFDTERAISEFEAQVQAGLVDVHVPARIEAGLRAVLLAHTELTELTLTFAKSVSFDEDGAALLATEGRGQVRVFRANTGTLASAVLDPQQAAWHASDPTAHPTFTTPAARNFIGRALWSDLAFSALDAGLPEARRRKTLTVQKAVRDPATGFLGVLRAGLLGDAVDQLDQHALDAVRDGHAHRVFVCDRDGRLITKLSAADTLATVGPDGRPDPDGDLRVQPRAIPAAIARALQTPGLAGVAEGSPVVTRFDIAGEPFLATFSELAPGRTHDWLVGVVVPEAYYLGDLQRARNQTLAIALGAVLLMLAGGALGLRTVASGFAGITGETDRLRALDLRPGVAKPPKHFSFAEVARAQESLELAKTAIRAMGMYVPMDLVRRLYREGREPQLGAEALTVSLMFTDVEGFTTQCEELAPDRLAHALGLYLQVMTQEIAATLGTVDKYIGDAVMVMWNAPVAEEQHAARACTAALACVAATQRLFETPAWGALPAWRTRVGLHTGTALVGHFGSPHRISYTAIGDSVNLAARLEGLNKAYGTQILGSEAVVKAAGNGFVFRHLDRVAVKGKHEGVEVFELLGVRGDARLTVERLQQAERYEAALALYRDRQFSACFSMVSVDTEDPPSRVLMDRCRAFIEQPPAPDWDGTFHPAGK